MKIDRIIKGMDISTLVEEEACNAKYYDCGQQKDLFDILQTCGVNSIRLRLWNDPYGEVAGTKKSCGPDLLNPVGRNGRYKYGAGTNDFETTVELARRAKAHGMSYLLDFHYSDFWADPGKQYPPKAWSSYTAQQLVRAVYDYTYDTLNRLKKLDLLPYMVQVGNELTNGCCWPQGNRSYDARIGKYRWQAEAAELEAYPPKNPSAPYFNPVLKDMLTAGITAVRDVSEDIVVMLHLDNGGSNELYRDWFDGFYACDGAGLTGGIAGAERGRDFDVIGLSYYPFWHGNFEALKRNMDDIAVRYGKELVIAEVSMGHSMEDYRRYERPKEALKAGADTAADEVKPENSDIELKGMATREELTRNLDYPMTPAGQEEFMRRLNGIIAEVPSGLGRGYYYWEPAWIPVPGCGWATPASLEYIHDKGPCGNEWANQALFDYEGNALPALKV